MEQVEQLFSAISPILRDRDGTTPSVDEEGRELPPTPQFTQEQQLLAKTVHLMKNDDTDTLLLIYNVARKVVPCMSSFFS